MTWKSVNAGDVDSGDFKADDAVSAVVFGSLYFNFCDFILFAVTLHILSVG